MPRCVPYILLLILLLATSCTKGQSGTTGSSARVLWTYRLGTARDLTADYIGDNTLICSSVGSLDWVDIRSGRSIHSLSDPSMYNSGLMWFASPEGQVYYMLRDGWNYGGADPQGPALACRDALGNELWQVSMPPGETLMSSAIGVGRIYLILSDGGVMCVDSAGNTLWYRQLNAARLTGFAALVSQRLVYLDREGYLCVASQDGELIWRAAEEFGFFSSTLELADGSLAIYDYPLALRCFDPAGQLLWQADFPEYAPGSPADNSTSAVSQYSVDRMLDALPGGGVVVAHADGRLSAFDAGGQRRWRTQSTGIAPLICSDADGNVFSSEVGGVLRAWNAQGRLIWTESTLGQLNSAPSVDGLGHVFVETATDLYCLDPGMPAAR